MRVVRTVKSINTLAEFVPINGEDKSNSSGEAISMRADTVKLLKILLGRLRVRFHLPSTRPSSDTPVSVNRFLCVVFLCVCRVDFPAQAPMNIRTGRRGNGAGGRRPTGYYVRLIAAGADLTRIHFLTAVSASRAKRDTTVHA